MSSSRASRVVCPVCAGAHPCVTRGSVAQGGAPVCACMSVYSSASRLGALRARGLHTMCLPGTGLAGLQTMKVFAFPEGRSGAGQGHTSLPPPGEDYCSENENQANSSGHLLLSGSRVAYRWKLLKRPSDAGLLGLWFAWPLPLTDAG